MRKRTLLTATVAIAAALATGCATPEPARQPNVVLIMADDQGWGDLSLHGNTNLSTPNIDSLAADGAMFDRFYVGPVCSPTRAELLTGRYHARGGVWGTSAGKERLNLDERTLAETFQAAGYATGAFGKWHNGSQHPYHPNARGFAEFYGFTSGHWAHYFDPVLDHNGKIVRGKGFITDDLTNHAIAFIEENREKPFLCYVPYNTPHSPMQVPDRFWEKFKDTDLELRNRDPEKENLPHSRAALAMVENVDWNVGRILESLDELGLAEDTIVIYLSDNGPNGWRWNGGMKGRKGSIDEGGVRVPALVRWSGKITPGKRIEQIAGAIDLLPTLADVVGIEIVGDKPLDGVSLEPLLLGSAADWPDREILSYRRGQVSVRTQQYRLDVEGALFDIEADPEQRTDIAAEQPEVAAKLRGLAAAKAQELTAELGEDDRPYPVGGAETTWLPARDATTSGSIERSARPPNSSYFRRWTRTADAVTWGVEVLEPGEYQALLYYAVPAADAGASVRLSFQGATTEPAKVEAHDPPVIGPDDDRAPRIESDTKDFRPMSLGSITLPAGRGPLVLEALEIPGGQALEVHSIVLERAP